jgi:hypothetical protein
MTSFTPHGSYYSASVPYDKSVRELLKRYLKRSVSICKIGKVSNEELSPPLF